MTYSKMEGNKMDDEQLEELLSTLQELSEADGTLTQKETATYILDFIAQLLY